MLSWFGRNTKKENSFMKYAIGFEDVQRIVKDILESKNCTDYNEQNDTVPKTIMITTISAEFVPPYPVMGWKEGNEIPLIRGTLDPEEEEDLINGLLMIDEPLEDIVVVVYGKNAVDESVMKKVKELRGLGFENVYGYVGGMFEWCLLSDIYGEKEFPFMNGVKKVDPLFYKVERSLDI